MQDLEQCFKIVVIAQSACSALGGPSVTHHITVGWEQKKKEPLWTALRLQYMGGKME